MSKVIFTQYRQYCVKDLSCGKEEEFLNGFSCLTKSFTS